MAHISENDIKIISAMRKFGVLDDIDPHRLAQEQGIIPIPCADGDQMIDIFQHQLKIALEGGVAPRPHQLSLNGGALLIAEESPLNKELREDLVLLAHIRGAMVLKKIRTVVLYAHAPCGAAGLAGLSFERCIDLLMKAKARVKKEIPGMKVACFCHVDRKGKKRTYFVSKEKWEAWRLQYAGHA